MAVPSSDFAAISHARPWGEIVSFEYGMMLYILLLTAPSGMYFAVTLVLLPNSVFDLSGEQYRATSVFVSMTEYPW